MNAIARSRFVVLRWAVGAAFLLAPAHAAAAQAAPPAVRPSPFAPPPAVQASPEPRPPPKPQPRPFGSRVAVDPRTIDVDDGDTVVIRWPGETPETVRILGIDTPETRHLEHDLPYAQPFGDEAAAFARGAFAVPAKVELLRSATLDPYG